MRKTALILVVLAAVLLSACGTSQQASDADMATRVAQILTSYPTPTGRATVEATLPLSTVEVSPTETASEVVEASPTEAAPTATEEPTATLAPTEEPTATQAPQQPTATNTEGPAYTYTPSSGPTSTPSPTDPRKKLGSPTGTDPMDGPDKWLWPTAPNKYSSIAFKDGYLLLTGLTKDSGWRLPALSNLSNSYIEMTAKPGKCTGLDNYGLIFRIPVFKEPDRGYLFAFSCSGKYALWKWDGTVGKDGLFTMLINWKSSDAIQAGEGKTNRMGVMALGSRLILYANGTLLEEVKDSTFGDGYFGVFVNPDTTQDFTVKVDEISYWDNPKQ